jgi:hypothetical protein
MEFLPDDDDQDLMDFVAARLHAKIFFQWRDDDDCGTARSSNCLDSVLVCTHRLTSNLLEQALFSLHPAQEWKQIGRIFGQEFVSDGTSGKQPQPTGPKTLYFTVFAVRLLNDDQELPQQQGASVGSPVRRLVWIKCVKELTGVKEDLPSLCRAVTSLSTSPRAAVQEVLLLHADPLHVSQYEEPDVFSEKGLMCYQWSDGDGDMTAHSPCISRCLGLYSAAIPIPLLPSHRADGLWGGLCTQFLRYCAESQLPSLLLVIPFDVNSLLNTRTAIELLCAVIADRLAGFSTLDDANFARWKRLVLASGPSNMYM